MSSMKRIHRSSIVMNITMDLMIAGMSVSLKTKTISIMRIRKITLKTANKNLRATIKNHSIYLGRGQKTFQKLWKFPYTSLGTLNL